MDNTFVRLLANLLYIDSSSWLGSYAAVEDLLSDTLMVSGIKWCPVINELLYTRNV